MTFSALSVGIALAAVWLIWKIIRALIVESPLDNIPGPPASSFLTGNFKELFQREGAMAFIDHLSENYGPVVKFHSLFGQRGLYVFDPKALHHIVLKDQDLYPEPDYVLAYRNIVFGPGLISTHGQHHRRQRKLLSPVFSMGNIKNLTPVFYESVHRLKDGIARQVGGHARVEMDMLRWMSRAALELIGQGGMGYSFDDLVEDTRNEYAEAIKQLIPVLGNCAVHAFFAPLVKYIPSSWMKRFLVEHAPSQAIRDLRDIIDTLDQMAREIYAGKVRALRGGDEDAKLRVGEGKDIMSVLLRENVHAAEEDRLPEEEVLAQMVTLISAGTDTTSNALSRVLYILADRQDVQDKLRAEITEARHGQDIPFDTLMDLPYLDAVCRETLRLYPPAISFNRSAAQDTVLPLSEPLRCVDETYVHEIAVPKGTHVVIAIEACNRNKDIWGEDACEWKPERWLAPLPDKVADARIPGVYANLMTFLGGGRACIGFKFSQLEMKVVLSVLLEVFKFHPSGKDVVWNRAVISYPTIGPVSTEPALPLQVEAIAS